MTPIATDPRTPAPAGRDTNGAGSPTSIPGLFLRVLIWLVAVASLMALSATVLYRREVAGERRVHEQRSQRVVDLGAEVVEREIESVAAEVRYLAEQSVLRDYLLGVPGARARLETDSIAFCRHKGTYDQIRFIDGQGLERLRINDNAGEPAAVPERELQSKAGRSYFAESIALGAGEVYVSALDLNIEHGEIERPLKPVIRFATPVHVDGIKRGVVVLNYLGARLLRKVSESATSFPGEVVMLNREGYYLVHPDSPQLEWGFQLGRSRSYADDHPEAWAEISRRLDGQRKDAEGLFTFRAIGGEYEPAGGLELVALVPDHRLRAASRALLETVLVGYVAVSPLLLGLVVFLVYVGAVRRGHERRIAESEARLRALSAQLFTAQEEERRTISRDLHDDLGQLVTTVGLKLEHAAEITTPEYKNRLIEEASVAVKTLIDRVREISTRLRPRMLDELGLKEAVRSYLGECEERLGITPDVELRFDRIDLPSEVAENVYRILQEATTNVAKHAEVTTVDVRLHVSDERVRLTVKDHGVGFDPGMADPGALGLLGMRERVELLGGTFRVRSARGLGTEIEVSIPWRPTSGS